MVNVGTVSISYTDPVGMFVVTQKEQESQSFDSFDIQTQSNK